MFTTKGNGLDADILVGLQKNPDSKLFSKEVSPTTFAVSVIQFNFSTALGQNADFREALRFGIDRKLLLIGEEDKAPAYELLPKSHWGRAGETERLDLPRAKAALSRVPRSILSTGIIMPIYTATTQAEFRKTPLGRLEEQLIALGVPVKFELTNDFSKVTDPKQSPILGAGIAVDYIDPLLIFSFFLPKGEFGSQLPNDEEFLKLYKDASVASSFDVRVQTVKSLSEYFLAKSYVLPLWERKTIHFVRRTRIVSAGEQPGGSTFYVDKVKLAEAK